MLSSLNRVIRWSFYLLFFLIPLVFVSDTSELFEFNKVMLTYAFAVIIVATWLVKMAIEKKFVYKRTFLEIPLLAYLLFHLLSTVFSIDPHISIWGYYSRFHEGLLASLSYILLYFAAVSNLKKDDVKKIILSSFASAIIVSLWGALEAFGHSPSCFMVTGKFDDACWIQDVRSRVFATLGQPNWMAAYLDVVILTSFGFVRKLSIRNLQFAIMCVLFLAALWFTKSRSGFIGLGAGLSVFALAIVKIDSRIKIFICALALIFGGLFGFHWYQNLPAPGPGITESEAIRKPVWEGAVKVWERYPILGSGVETFAYSFYLDRPASKNLDSEWDFLYNKAHNEYLNILATTGTVGFLSYLGILGVFSLWFIRKMTAPSKQGETLFIITGLFAAWVSILVTNFFGFSVVIMGLFFFLIPAFCEILSDQRGIVPEKIVKKSYGIGHIGLIGLICLLGLISEFHLLSRWQADKQFNVGKSLDGQQQFLTAYPSLVQAVLTIPDEPTFRDELSYNQAVLANLVYDQLHNSTASALVNLSESDRMSIKIPQLGVSELQLEQEAIKNSDSVIASSPHSVPFWKTRVKTFLMLSQINIKYYDEVIRAISTASRLAPTDAKIFYNLGLILKRAGRTPQAIEAVKTAVKLKPDYSDAIKWLEENK